MRRGIFIASFCSLVWACAFLGIAQENATSSEPTLPDQIGFVNDYGNQISGAQQNELEKRLQAIKEDFALEIIVMTSIIDPMDNAKAYAEKIAEAWELGENTILVLFAKYGGKWSGYAIRIGSEAAKLLNKDEARIEKLKTQITDFHLKRQNVKAAIVESVEIFESILQIDKKSETPSETNSANSGFNFSMPSLGGVGIAALAFVGVVGLFVGVRVALKRFCPRCGRRLRNYRGPARSYRSSQTYVSCPNCGYGRMR
jgi:uncharacterized membrane protein YgcG